MNYHTLIDMNDGNDLPYALFLPTYTAIAWYHGKLCDELQQMPIEEAVMYAREFAQGPYTQALFRGGSLPLSEKEELIELIKKKGLWEEFAMLNYSKFNSQGRKGELDKDIMGKISLEEDWRVSLSKRKDLEE